MLKARLLRLCIFPMILYLSVGCVFLFPHQPPRVQGDALDSLPIHQLTLGMKVTQVESLLNHQPLLHSIVGNNETIIYLYANQSGRYHAPIHEELLILHFHAGRLIALQTMARRIKD